MAGEEVLKEAEADGRGRAAERENNAWRVESLGEGGWGGGMTT